MKYQIRKAEQMTVWLASEPVELDPKKFKKLSENPYTGDGAEDFVKYIAGLDFYDLPHDLDEKTLDLLNELHEGVMQEFDNSAQKYANTWLELGEKNEEYRRTGGFRIIESTHE